MELFPRRLYSLMEENKTSQYALGKAIGASRQSIAQYLDGDTKPSGEKLCAIANHYNVSIDYLVGRVDYRSTDETVQGICEKTGLSSEAVEVLRNLKTGAAEKWEYSMPYKAEQKEGVYNLLNAVLNRDELLEDFLLLAGYIEAVAVQNAIPPDAAAKMENAEGPYTLNPHEMKEYREYLVIEQARRFAFKAMQKLAVPKTDETAVDVPGLKFYYGLKAEGGEP